MVTTENMILQPNQTSFSSDVFIKEKDAINDLVVVIEAAAIYIYGNSDSRKKSKKKIKRNPFKNFKLFIPYFKSIVLGILLVIAGIFILITYLLVTPFLRVFINSKAKKLASMHELIKSRIQRGAYTLENLKHEHTRTKDFLDKHTDAIDKLKGERIFRPAFENLLNELKKVELTQRLAAYPDHNEVVLSYDDLKELRILMTGFECASEQSDVYKNHSQNSL